MDPALNQTSAQPLRHFQEVVSNLVKWAWDRGQHRGCVSPEKGPSPYPVVREDFLVEEKLKWYLHRRVSLCSSEQGRAGCLQAAVTAWVREMITVLKLMLVAACT